MKVQSLVRRVLVLALSVAVVPAGSALAATGHVYAGQFGSVSSDAGQLLSPARVAVSPSGSTVYVADWGTGAVQGFDASGDPGVRFDGASTPAGGMFPTGVAATASDVWIADSGSGVINRFDTAGAYQSQITGADTPAAAFGFIGGVAVDPTSALPESGYLYVADPDHQAIDVFDATGTYVRQITDAGGTALGAPSSVAVDRDGDVFVVDSANAFVAEYAPGGTSFTRIVERGRPDEGRIPQAVAADPSTGNVYVVSSGPDGPYVTDHRPNGTSNVFSSPRVANAMGIAVSPTSHAVFVADPDNQVVHRFRTTTLPDAVTDPASAVTATTADVNGTIDPLGIDTSYRFDYGLDSSYGLSGGDGYLGPLTGPQPVTATLGDLQPNATYHFRVAAIGPNGTELGADRTFTTDPAAPALGKQSATAISQSSATLTAQVNPNNSPTTYHFEVGTDTTYRLGSAPVPDAALGAGFGFQDATADLAAAGIALAPDTTYHFRVVADNGVGSPVVGADKTFHTLPLSATAVTGDASNVTGHSATVSGTVDPGGSTAGSATTYRFQYGTDTDYRSGFVPDVPAAAGSTPGAVTRTATLTGLKPSTTYHFRIVATNGAGTVTGADQTFTTAAAPPAVTAGAATDVSAGAATISGSVDPQGLRTTWVLELGTDTSYGMRWFGEAGDGLGAQAVSVHVTNLAPGTTYHYRLVATNADGTTASSDGTFATAGVAMTLAAPPVAVTPAVTGTTRDLSPTPKKPSVKKPKAKSKKKAKGKKKASAKKRKKTKKGSKS